MVAKCMVLASIQGSNVTLSACSIYTCEMTIAVSLLRAVNVGGRQVKKDELVAIHKAAGCIDPETFIASGNIVFGTREKDLAKLAARIEKEFERVAGFRSEAILRTLDDLRGVVARNPLGERDGSKLVVTFLASEPSTPEIEIDIDVTPEEMFVIGREMYVYFPNGQGQSKFPAAKVAKALGGVIGTARNWNTVNKLIEIAARRS